MSLKGKLIVVTGGTGFLGVNLVDELLKEEALVRILVRTGDKGLEGIKNLELRPCSVTDRSAIEEQSKGAFAIFHLAGVVDHSRLAAPYVYRVNVEGTRNVMLAAAKHGCKVVMASTSGTVAVSRVPTEIRGDSDGYAQGVIDNWPYYDSKRKAEEVAQEVASSRGVPLVIIRPTSILGPSTPRLQTAKSLEYYRTKGIYKHLAQRVPYVPDGGLSFCDVRDITQAFLKALLRPQAEGKAFCLGSCNMTIKDFLSTLEDISGVPRTKLQLPFAVGWSIVAAVHKIRLAVTGKPYHVDPVLVEMAHHYWYIDSSEAKQTLDYHPRPCRETLSDTVNYIAENSEKMSLPYPLRLPPKPPGTPRAKL